ncbi:MAG: TauD/TfdA family dioxygenase [Alphaproteobacteria bacterium]
MIAATPLAAPFGAEITGLDIATGLGPEEMRAVAAGLQEHRFIHRHAYRVGDIAIWDNAATLHAGTPIDIAGGKDTRRRLYRISVKGKPAICA